MAEGKLRLLYSNRLKPINPDGIPLTIEKFRELSGLTDIADDEVEKAVQSIQLLVKILYDFARKDNSICIDNQQVVYLKEQKHAA